MRKIGSSLCCMAFLIALLVSASAAHAQKMVTVFTDGCWIQRTIGQGTDNVGYVVALDLVPGSGTWDPSGVKTWWYAMGTYNDHGGARRQEVQKGTLARFALCPGDSAEIVIGVYGSSNGGLFQRIANGLAGIVNDIKNKLPGAGIQQGGALGVALAVGGPRAAGMLSSLLRSNGENCFVGSVRVTVVCDQRGNIRWSYAPQDSAWDMGRNPQGTNTIGVGASGGRPEYWFKVGVRY